MSPLRSCARKAGCILACLMAVATVQAQALNPVWDGEWTATETTQGKPDSSLRIERKGISTQLVQSGQTCRLVYDGMTQTAALARQIQALQDWQLAPQHWPVGTQPAHLLGLRREFDAALHMVDSLGNGRYRITRIRGEGCDDADDIFFVLHAGQRLMRVRFPSTSLGVDITVFQRKGSP